MHDANRALQIVNFLRVIVPRLSGLKSRKRPIPNLVAKPECASDAHLALRRERLSTAAGAAFNRARNGLRFRTQCRIPSSAESTVEIDRIYEPGGLKLEEPLLGCVKILLREKNR